MAADRENEDFVFKVRVSGQGKEVVRGGYRPLIAAWIWSTCYELQLEREQFFFSLGVLDFVVASVSLLDPSGPPTLLGAAAVEFACTIEVCKLVFLKV
jgi:hypothetical protein